MSISGTSKVYILITRLLVKV